MQFHRRPQYSTNQPRRGLGSPSDPTVRKGRRASSRRGVGQALEARQSRQRAASTSCPLCNGPSHRVFAKWPYWIRDCEACGHRFARIGQEENHVEHVYSDDYFSGGETGYHDYLGEGELLVRQGRRYAGILQRFLKPGSILDVGSAAGFMLKGYEDAGWKARGVEPNRRMAEYARSRLGLHVTTGTLEELSHGEVYDVISMIQVLAHFLDPRAALGMALKITKPGGYWLIESWNRNSWTTRMLGRYWHEYNPPSVLHWFSRRSLRRLLSEFGMQEVAHGWPLKWIHASHAKSAIRHSLESSRLGPLVTSVVRIIPDLFPLLYPGDDVCWSLYQRSPAGKSP